MSYYIGLSILSNNPGSRQKRENRQKLLSAEARRILSHLEGRPVNEDDMAYEENGRPFFPGSSIDFNISHSGNMAAVSYFTSGGEPDHLPCRTGCDVQTVRSRANTLKIAERFFTAVERDYIFSLDTKPFIESRFFQIWTLKECYLKLRGLSVFDMTAAPSFICGDEQEGFRFAFNQGASSPGFPVLSFFLYGLSGPAGERYILASAIEGQKQIQPELRWFSQSLLPCSIIAAIKAAPSPARTVSPKM